MGWPPSTWADLTLREIEIPYEYWLVDRWNHTAQISGMLYAVQGTIAGSHGTRLPQKEVGDFHPLLAKKTTRGVLDPKDAGMVLRKLGEMMMR